MAASDYNSVVQQLYVAYFGRPADTLGLTNFTTALNAAGAPTTMAGLTAAYNTNSTIKTLIDQFGSSAESAALYSGDTLAFVNSIYTNVLNRSADLEGLLFWSNAINNGSLTRGNAAASIMAGALANTSTQGVIDAAIVANKTTVAANFTAAIDTAAEVLAYTGNTAAATARTMLATVTNTTDTTAFQTTVTSTLSSISTATAATGSTFALTTGVDSITGTSGNDTINAVAGTGATLFAGDVVNGGAGTDTMSIVHDASFTVVGTNVTNIEKFSSTNVAGAARTITFAGVTGVTDVMNSGSTTNSDVIFAGLAAPANVTVQNTTAATTVNTAGVSGTSDTINLTLSGAGSSTVYSAVTLAATTAATNEYEALNIASNGSATNNITLTTDGTQTSLKTVTITGSAGLGLRLANDNVLTSATVINASAATGAVSIGSDSAGATIVLGAAAHSVTLGTGNDTVYFGANLNSSDTVDGGTGTDTIGVTAAVSNTILTNVKNIEVVRFDIAGGNITQDASITSLANVNYAVIGGNTLTLNNLANNTSTTVIGNTATLTQGLKDASGLSDTLTVTLGSGTANPTLTTLSNVTGLETLNLVSAGGTSTNTITTDSVTAKHVITGSVDLTITNAVAASAVDASAFTGKLNIKGQAAAATNIQGGTGNDTVVLGTAADTVNAGAGNDLIQLGTQASNNTSGADVIVTGTGNDTLRFVGNTAAGNGGATDYTAFAAITDFTVGTSTSASDFLAFSGTDTDFSLKTASGATTTTTGLAKGATAQGLAATDTMVVQTLAQNATATALTANVSFFKLTTGVAFTTDIKGTFAAALGTASVTGLGANGNYLISVYDTTNSKAVIGVVNVGGNADADTVLLANDFVNADVAVVGVLNMTAADYANFGATNLAAAF